MIDKIYVFDDIIDIKFQDILEKYFLENSNLFKDINNVEYMNNGTYMPQSIMSTRDIDTHIDSIVKSIELNSISKIDKEILHTYRYKINQLKVSDKISDEFDINGMHIDREQQHISIVYYVNDTDGDTHIYDTDLKTMSGWNYIVRDKKFEHFTLNKRISPKKGRVVIFNGLLPHHSSYPTLNDRYVINFNTVIKTESKSLF